VRNLDTHLDVYMIVSEMMSTFLKKIELRV
jgi:hypothetical protein